MWLIAAVLSTFLFGLVLTPLVRLFAHRIGMVATPRPDRWHQRPTALLGGVAIYVSFGIGYLIFSPRLSVATPILVAGTLLFITGIIDDFLDLKPYLKLVVQLVAAALLVYSGLYLPWTSYVALNGLITIFWLIGITNAVNLLDNMDGLAGGISMVACAFLTITFWLNGQFVEAMIPALLAGTLASFLFFNANPATIFMGDCGSMFLGIMLGGISLLSDYGRSRNVSSILMTPVLIMIIPILDTCLVTLTRKLSGRRVSQGGRDHSSHRLVALGMSEKKSVLMLCVLAFISGSLALAIRWIDQTLNLLIIPAFTLIVLFIGLYLGKVRVYGTDRPVDGTIISELVNFTYKRRVFEVLLDVLLIALSYYGAYLLRWDGYVPEQQMTVFLRTLPLIIAIEIVFFLGGGVYRRIWRYVGVTDLIVIARSVLGGATVGTLIVFLMYRFVGPSRGVFILNAILLMICVSTSRLSFRLLQNVLKGQKSPNPNAVPVIIYGAGDGGELLVREINNKYDEIYLPIGFIDDDIHKVGKSIHGYHIFDSKGVGDLVLSHGIRTIIVSSSKVPESKLEELRLLQIDIKRMKIGIVGSYENDSQLISPSLV